MAEDYRMLQHEDVFIHLEIRWYAIVRRFKDVEPLRRLFNVIIGSQGSESKDLY